MGRFCEISHFVAVEEPSQVMIFIVTVRSMGHIVFVGGAILAQTAGTWKLF